MEVQASGVQPRRPDTGEVGARLKAAFEDTVGARPCDCKFNALAKPEIFELLEKRLPVLLEPCGRAALKPDALEARGRRVGQKVGRVGTHVLRSMLGRPKFGNRGTTLPIQW